MHDGSADPVTTRLEVYNSFKRTFASAPIRLMSRTVSAMRAMGHDDLASAIGDMDWRTVPADDPEDPTLREQWANLLANAMAHVDGWLPQLSEHPMGYNLDSLGYPAVVRAWSELWKAQLGITMENLPQQSPQVFLFHGGNQAVQGALLGVMEAHRTRVGTGRPCTMLVPVPTFSCPLDQMALQGMQVYLMPPRGADLDPSPESVAAVPEGVEVDGVYAMPINNPTGRTLDPERMRAFVSAVLDRWPHAAIILDAVYVRLHPDHRQLMAWYDSEPRFAAAVIFIDSLSKTHGVTGLRAGALMTRAERFADGVTRYAQNVVAGPSNAMQAAMLAMLSPFVTGDQELQRGRIRLQVRIGNHLQRRRRLLLAQAFERWGHLLDEAQPALPDAETFNWRGSMYAVPQLGPRCVSLAAEREVSPTVAFYLESGIAGVPMQGFCRNPNLERHGLVINSGDPALVEFTELMGRFVRLSFGMTPPPAGA